MYQAAVGNEKLELLVKDEEKILTLSWLLLDATEARKLWREQPKFYVDFYCLNCVILFTKIFRFDKEILRSAFIRMKAGYSPIDFSKFEKFFPKNAEESKEAFLKWKHNASDRKAVALWDEMLKKADSS